MKKIKDDATGFEIIITKDKLKIEMPITNLVRGFNLSPNNYDERKIKKGRRQEFIECLADNLFDDANQDTGDNFVAEMLDNVFCRFFEDDLDFMKIPNEDY